MRLCGWLIPMERGGSLGSSARAEGISKGILLPAKMAETNALRTSAPNHRLAGKALAVLGREPVWDPARRRGERGGGAGYERLWLRSSEGGGTAQSYGESPLPGLGLSARNPSRLCFSPQVARTPPGMAPANEYLGGWLWVGRCAWGGGSGAHVWYPKGFWDVSPCPPERAEGWGTLR